MTGIELLNFLCWLGIATLIIGAVLTVAPTAIRMIKEIIWRNEYD